MTAAGGAGGWRDDIRFLQYVGLFDRREFFAAHEALEDMWRDSAGEEREFLQGLIQLAVALEHAARGNSEGALSVLGRARGRLSRREAGDDGLDVGRLLKEAADYIAGSRHEPPRIQCRGERMDVRVEGGEH